MKAYGGVDVQIKDFLTSTLVAGEWLASRSGRFTHGTHWTGEWVDRRAGLDDREKGNFFSLTGTLTVTFLLSIP
jgi:hypothetical protein